MTDEKAPESDAEERRTYPGIATLRVAFDSVQEALEFLNAINWQVQSSMEPGDKLLEFSVKALDDTDQEVLL